MAIEAAYLTGNIDGQYASGELDVLTRHSKQEVRLRACLAIGQILADTHDHSEASRVLQQASQIAIAIKDRRAECEANLRKLQLVLDTDGPSAASAIAAPLARMVADTGDVHLFAFFHVRVGGIEAKRSCSVYK
jgi:hypothetical protein